MAAEEEELEGPDEMPEAADDELVEEDVSCLRCNTNLRGHKADGNCPNCGARISRSLRAATEQVLCPACLRPNHPKAPVCVHCTAPIQGAASTANYYRTTPISGRGHDSADDDDDDVVDQKDPPTKAWMIIGWCIGGPPILMILLGITALLARLFTMYGVTLGEVIQDLVMSLLMLGIGGLFPFLIVYLPTRNYIRKRQAYEKGRAFEVMPTKEPTSDQGAQTATKSDAPEGKD